MVKADGWPKPAEPSRSLSRECKVTKRRDPPPILLVMTWHQRWRPIELRFRTGRSAVVSSYFASMIDMPIRDFKELAAVVLG